jgi:STE24 endopeptidase
VTEQPPEAESEPEAARDFTPAELERARALRRAQWPPALAARAAGPVLLAALGLTPAGAALVAACGGAWWARAAGGAVLLCLLAEAVALPFAALARRARARFGLVTQGWGGWAADVARGLLAGVPLAVTAALAVYGLGRAAPRFWWAWAALAAGAAVAALSWLAPVLLEPLFNRFTPLPDGPLRADLLGLADRAGVRVREVLVADASRRTTALNAYVSGYGRTRRVVVHDTLLTGASPAEVRAVVAHELGHVRHRDTLTGTLAGVLGAAAGVCVLAALLSWRPLLDLSGAHRATDPRGMASAAACAALLGAVTGPAVRLLGRRAEARADRFALDLTADPCSFVAMQRRLTVANVTDPDPPRALHVLFGTHPTPAARIAAARAHPSATAG